MFDILRAAAALLVFAFHYSGLVSPLTSGVPWIETAEWMMARMGSLGTNLLLLLSGYFIAFNMASGRFRYRRFVELRLARVYVPFLVVLLLATLFKLAIPQAGGGSGAALTWRTVLSNLILLPGLFPERPILTVTWTLSYIVAGYLLLPAVCVVIDKAEFGNLRRIFAWTALVTASFLCASMGIFSTRFTYIPMGCLLAEFQRGSGLSLHRTFLLRTVAITGAVALAARVMMDGRLLIIDHAELSRAAFSASGLLTVSMAMAAALIAQERYDLYRMVPFLSLVTAFGRTGYSFYLLHGPVVKSFAVVVFPWLAIAGFPAPVYWSVMPACLMAATLAARLLYQYVELPWRDRLIPKARQTAQAAREETPRLRSSASAAAVRLSALKANPASGQPSPRPADR
ncbi:MAG: acyltransferase [Bryobacterales bacterium]|nr:acyltransferase [Bryobacterales bacterium]